MAAPWFKIFPLELLGKPETSQLTDDQLGKLLRLWALASMDGCSIPSDPVAIGKLLRMQKPNQMVNQMVWLSQFFRPMEGNTTRLVSVRLQKEAQAYEDKCAKLRANGCLGGASKRAKSEPNGYPIGLPNAQPIDNQMAPEGEREGEVEKETTTPLPPEGGLPAPQALLEEPVQEKAKKERKPAKPRGRNYTLATLELPEDTVSAFDRVWKAWPRTGWNFSTRSEAPRRLNREQALERFSEIIRFSKVAKADGSTLTAEDLADSACSFVAQKLRESRGAPPCVPCIANYFSSCEGEKHPWKEGLLSYFGMAEPVLESAV